MMSKFFCFFGFFLVFNNIYAEANLQLPPGFHISVYADNVPAAREMALGDDQIVYVGTSTDRVYALIPNSDATAAKKVITLAENLQKPNGVAYYKGDLYVAVANEILHFPKIAQHLDNPPSPSVIHDQPLQKADYYFHELRVIHFSPDGWLYLSSGSPCNSCERKKNSLFATISRMRPDGSDVQIYATGVRDSVGFDWQPETNVLWFTDNGQDFMGDDKPPDEINRALGANMNFGFPYVYGDNIPSPGYEKKALPLMKDFTPPVFNLPAHVAPLGLTFYTGKLFPKEYQQQIFIAEHGSWNSSVKVGYQVIYAKVVGDKITEVKPFISGFLDADGQTVKGRPVDILNMPDGSLLISDDFNGKIYRVTYAP